MANATVDPVVLDQCAEVTSAADAAAVAIVTADGTPTTRGKLRQMAEGVACRLLAAGLKPGDRVGVLAHQSPQAIAAFIGASLAGIVYAPLDTKSEPSYLRIVLADHGITALLTDREGVADAFAPIPVLPLSHPDDASPAAAAMRAALIGDLKRRPRSSEEGGYLFSTSGSTGRPKGVLINHRSPLAYVGWAIRQLAIKPTDVILGTAPIYFAYSATQIYGALWARARMVIPPEPAGLFPGLIIKALEREKVTLFMAVPTLLRTLLDTGAFKGEAGRNIRAIVYSGEPCQARVMAGLMRAMPHARFYNLYGATESQVSLHNEITQVPAEDAELPLGLPAPYARVQLLDGAGRPVPDGEIGEISIDSPGLMAGYVTAEGFKPASRPFGLGDFARRGADGLFYYCGRRDQQVKLRGLRIMLPAVDQALLACAGVKEAAAYVIGDDLVACVSGEKLPDEAQLAATCRARLPSASQPHRYLAFQAFPRLSNGKTDRIGLKALAAERVRVRG